MKIDDFVNGYFTRLSLFIKLLQPFLNKIFLCFLRSENG